MNRKTVKLVQPIEHFGKRIAEVELREPPTKQFLEFGEPRTPMFSPTGTVYYVETPGVFEKYLDYCISSPEEGYTCYIKLGFEDAREVKEQVLNFFTEADLRRSARRSAPSSSASASSSGTSPAT